MTTDRSYRSALPLDEAIAELHACAATQFDPSVVEALVAVAGEGTPVALAGVLAA
jgi:HD-GYP domain-containing protein (c-di-GMP phosphodiesterase class II)